MDPCGLKGRSPFPFETIGVMVSLSAGSEEVLAEAGYLANIFGARLLLIQMGKQTTKLQTTFDTIYERTGTNIQEATRVWLEDVTVKTLLTICKENSVDLLILETIQREGVLRYYLGSLARGISRTAKCSLLLLTEPKLGGTTFRKIIVSGVSHPKTSLTLGTAFYFAKQVGAHTIAIVTELDQPTLSMATAYMSTVDTITNLKQQIVNDEIERIHGMVERCHPEGLNITEEAIFGRLGYTIRQYAKNYGADLLVINSPDAKYGIIDRIFTHDMEYILEDLPCNVLIVHSRNS